MGEITKKYKANLVLDLPFNQGTLKDKSGYGNNASASVGVAWQNMRKMRSLKITGTAGIVVADSASMRYSEATVMLLLGRGLTSATQRIYCHRDGSGFKMDFYQSGALTLGTILGTSGFTYTITGNEKTIAVKMFATATKPQLFVNGVYIGEGNATLAMGTTNCALTIGNYYSGATQPTTAPFAHVVVFNTTTITGQDLAQLHNELIAEQSVGNPQTSNYKGVVPVIEASCLLAYDMESKTGDGKMADLSGNGRNGTITKAVKKRMPSGFDGANFDGVVDVSGGTISAAASFSLGTSHTLEWIMSGGASGNMIPIGTDTSNFCAYYLPTLNGIMYRANGVDVTWTISALDGKEHHYVLDRSGTTLILYMDGVSLGTKTLASNEINSLQSIGGVSTYYWNGSIGYVQVYSVSKGAVWAKNRYNKYAQKVVYVSQPEKWLPTLADVTAGKIGNTDFRVSTGTWRVSEETSGKKWIENVVAGVASMPFTNSSGTWIFDVNKADASNPSVLFIADVIGAENATGQDGYSILLSDAEAVTLRESVNGTPTTLFASASSYIAHSTNYKIAVSRSSAGEFVVYIKGGVYTNWTLVAAATGANPITDTTAKTPKYIVFDLDAGDKMSNIRYFQGVLGEVSGTSPLDYYATTNDSGGAYLSAVASIGLAQSFTVAAPSQLSRTQFYLKKIGSPTGNAVAKLYTHSGVYGTSSLPGTLLATSDNFDVSTLTSSKILYNFVFSGVERVDLAAGYYVLSIEYAGGDAGNYVTVADDEIASTHSGKAAYKMPDWHSFNGDLVFYVYGVSSASFPID